MKYLRVKLPSMQLLEIDTSTICAYDIAQDDETNDYSLCAFGGNGTMFILTTGKFDKCHAMLNKIHELLNIETVDL